MYRFSTFSLQITDVVKFSQILLKHGTDAEILSLKHLIHSQLNRVANQKTGTTFVAAVETAIRNASWDMWADHLTQEKQSNGLTLPEVRDGVESDDDNGMIFEYRNRSLFMTSGGTKEKCFSW